MTDKKSENLNANLKRLEEISNWFDKRGEVDVEEGLKMVKEAVGLIKASRQRIKEIENEFEEIKKEIDQEDTSDITSNDEITSSTDQDINPKDIPF